MLKKFYKNSIYYQNLNFLKFCFTSLTYLQSRIINHVKYKFYQQFILKKYKNVKN